jgi:hypothetical protein
MVVGRILADAKDRGSGFALAPRVAVTANHVVRGRAAGSLHLALGDGRSVPVDRVEGDETLDVAVLHLGEEVPEVLAVGRAVAGADWRVEAQPRGNDPLLTGTIDTLRRRFINAEGHETEVMQLRVDQQVGDYEGYSGGAVMLQSPRGAVIGVLVEQLRWRLATPIGQPRPAANILYAIPIQHVLDRFGLAAVSVARPVRFSAPHPRADAIERPSLLRYLLAAVTDAASMRTGIVLVRGMGGWARPSSPSSSPTTGASGRPSRAGSCG